MTVGQNDGQPDEIYLYWIKAFPHWGRHEYNNNNTSNAKYLTANILHQNYSYQCRRLPFVQ